MSGRVTTAEEHRRALARVDVLMDLEPATGTPEADELLALVAAIERYEWRTEGWAR